MRLATLAGVLLALASGLSLAAAPAPSKQASSKPAPAQNAQIAFGLVESVALLQACPQAQFDNASLIALGAVITENKARIDAAPLDQRMALMTQLVSETTEKGEAYRKRVTFDCDRDPERAAAYWNRIIATMADGQKPKPGAASSKLTP
jgi:hypothetical protein